MERNRFLNYLIIALYTFVVHFTYFLLAIFLAGRGLGGGRTGFLLMLYTATALFGSFLIGFFEDRFGARGNTLFGLALVFLFYLGLAFARGFPSMVALFFIGGLGNNVVRVTMNALFLKSHDPSRQGREIGLYTFLPQFSMGTGVIAGSLLLTAMDFRTVFLSSSAILLALVGCAALLRPASLSAGPLSMYGRDLAKRRVLLFVAALVLFCLHWGAEIACYAPFLRDDLGLGTASSGIFMGVPIVFLGCVSYYFGVRRDRGDSSVRLVLVAIALSGAGLIAFGAMKNVAAAFAFRLVHEAGDAAFTVFSYVGIARLFPRERLGGTSGSMFVAMVSAQSVGALVFGWIGGAFGYPAAYLAAGACSLAAIPLILSASAEYHYH